MFENTSIAIMYAITPCHAGSETSLGVIDNPIQRERHTGWPVIQSSGVKGAFRANFDKFKTNIKDIENLEQIKDLTNQIFGTSTSEQSSSGYAGSCSISDAKILAFPMRSNKSPFVWITCPEVLKRFCRDLEILDEEKTYSLPDFDFLTEEKAVSIGSSKIFDKGIVLEDMEVETDKTVSEEITKKLEDILPYFKDVSRLLIVNNDIFNYGVNNCTQILTQIKINQVTGTTQDGSLRYQEELPSDTLMYTVINWGDSKAFESNLKADMIKKYVTEKVIKRHIQIAGDESCGRGIFKITWK